MKLISLIANKIKALFLAFINRYRRCKVYEFLYNPDTWESAATTISIHKSKKGAKMALESHRNEIIRQHNLLWEGEPAEETPAYNYNKYWEIRETKLQE